jgi:hypothetical protein
MDRRTKRTAARRVMERPTMSTSTRESGRADFLLRMPPELKARLAKAAAEDGTTIRDLVLYAIEQMLDIRDGEVAADKKRADLEHRLSLKFDELVAALAGGDLTGLKAAAFARLQEKAEAALAKWRDYAGSDHHAEPRTLLERLCLEHGDLEAELEGARRISTFGDEGMAGCDPDDPDDCDDEPEPDDELAAPGDPDDGE